MSDDLVSRLRQDAEMLQDGPQRNLTKLWHSEVVKDAAKDCHEAATALTEARAEIERLQSNPPLLDARSLPGVDALVKTLEAQLDEALRSCLAEREGRLKAETAISTLRARVREVVGPFAKAGELFGPRLSDEYDQCIYSPAAGDEYSLCGDHLRAARQLMEEVK